MRAIIIFVLSLMPFMAQAQAIAPKFKEGVHFSKLEKPLPEGISPVIEFFYYGCETCYKLAPAIAQWAYEKKVDISLIPVHSENAMVDEARIFHTLTLVGALGKMYEEGFLLVQSKESKLQGVDRINEALDRHGVDKNKFWETWKSDAVNQRLASSAALTKQAQITKTPTFIVQGIYKVDITSIKSTDELFELLTYLMSKQPSAEVPALLKKNH